MKAFEEEFQSLMENKSWELVPRTAIPTNSNIIGHKWIGRYKPGYGEVPARFKGRLTAVGSRQRYGVDFDETFAPVPRSETVRAALSLMATLDMDIVQIDIKTAFLNATLDTPVYMTQPEGFVETGKEDYVCRLLKALYGTKQAPRLWSKRLDEAIVKFGLKPISADSCIFVRINKEEKSILIKFVDDLVYGSTLSSSLEKFSQFMGTEFEVRFLPLKRFIGINVVRDRSNRKIFISQTHQILKILEEQGLTNCNPKSTPADSNARLNAAMVPKSEGEKKKKPTTDYRSAVGALLYLATITRPDISYAVSQVAKYCENPKPAHWNAVKRIFAYLKGTCDYGLWLEGRDEGVIGYTDADYAGDTDNSKSTSGNIFLHKGGPIAWGSSKQTCVALSTTESEYIAATKAGQTAIWLGVMEMELENETSNSVAPTPASVPVYCDNQSAIRLVKNAEFHQRTRHINVRYHFIKDYQEKKLIDLQYVESSNQLADIFTKPLPAPAFTDLRERIGVELLPKK